MRSAGHALIRGMALGTPVHASTADAASGLLREEEAAAFLNVSRETLRTWRRRWTRTTGPPFIRINRAVRYRRDDLVAFVAKHLVEPKTWHEAR